MLFLEVIRSKVLTAKSSNRSNDDYEVLKLKDFQRPFTSDSKTFKGRFHFQGFSRVWKNGYFSSRTCGHPIYGCPVRLLTLCNAVQIYRKNITEFEVTFCSAAFWNMATARGISQCCGSVSRTPSSRCAYHTETTDSQQ